MRHFPCVMMVRFYSSCKKGLLAHSILFALAPLLFAYRYHEKTASFHSPNNTPHFLNAHERFHFSLRLYSFEHISSFNISGALQLYFGYSIKVHSNPLRTLPQKQAIHKHLLNFGNPFLCMLFHCNTIPFYIIF